MKEVTEYEVTEYDSISITQLKQKRKDSNPSLTATKTIYAFSSKLTASSILELLSLSQ